MTKLLTILSCLICATLVSGQNPLFIPPTLTGTEFNLNMQHGTHTFIPGTPSPTMGFNGNILGPTLILNVGDSVSMNVTNSIGEETTVHWHGLHVSAKNDGGPHTIIDPNSTWQPAFEVNNKAATYWYHPHLHHETFKQVALGLSGLILVKDQEEAALNLPHTYGVDDFPCVIQTKAINSQGIIQYRGIGSQAFKHDTFFMVNATMDPTLEVPAQVIRLRILNGASHRTFLIGLSNDDNFHQIASDASLLPVTFTRQRMILSPGERAEILIDAAQYPVGGTFSLVNYAPELPPGFWGGPMPRIGGASQDGLDTTVRDLLTFTVVAPTTDPVTTIPTALADLSPIPPETADRTMVKYLGLSPGGPTIGPNPNTNQNPLFDLGVINDTIIQGETIIWELHGDPTQTHPFHLHDVPFFILDRNGVPPTQDESGLKDMVIVYPEETVRFITKFTSFSDDETPYMYHCHILPHEDVGMMGQFLVLNPNLLFVDKNYTGVETGSFSRPFNTLREAVAAAPVGATITFKSSGAHEEVPPQLLLSNQVNIVLQNGSISIQ